MNIVDILVIGVGLSMDAFAVSICKGLAMKKMDIKKALVCSLYFGVFQALMPLIGFLLAQFDHIFAYLTASHITIEGFETKEEIEAEVKKIENEK